MISIIGRGKHNSALYLRGLSTDAKPTVSFSGVVIANGSEFEEIDTGVHCYYDGYNNTWVGNNSSIPNNLVGSAIVGVAIAG